MAVPVNVPRINNNDDEVTLVEFRVRVGDSVSPGQLLASIETDKATVDIDSPATGFVLALHGDVGAQVRVGEVLIWLGESVDEPVPALAAPIGDAAASLARPTAKALALLQAYGLDAAAVPCTGDRLGADDVERHAAAKGLKRASPVSQAAAGTAAPATALRPQVAGTLRPLLSHERGMLHTVSWQRDVAVPGYIEMAFDAAAWAQHAARFGEARGLLLNPLLPLMAWRLVELAAASPRWNATLVDEQRHEYGSVNLGFTVQAGEVLYLAVVRDAATLGEEGFVHRLIDVQRRAAAHALVPAELSGATIGFSSMSRWKVARHVPVLAPNTAVMVAHTVDADGRGVLGATYDHRVLHGGEVTTLLRKLAAAPKAGADKPTMDRE